MYMDKLDAASCTENMEALAACSADVLCQTILADFRIVALSLSPIPPHFFPLSFFCVLEREGGPGFEARWHLPWWVGIVLKSLLMCCRG